MERCPTILYVLWDQNNIKRRVITDDDPSGSIKHKPPYRRQPLQTNTILFRQRSEAIALNDLKLPQTKAQSAKNKQDDEADDTDAAIARDQCFLRRKDL